MIEYGKRFTNQHDTQFIWVCKILGELVESGIHYRFVLWDENYTDWDQPMASSTLTEVYILVESNNSPGFAMFKLKVNLVDWCIFENGILK